MAFADRMLALAVRLIDKFGEDAVLLKDVTVAQAVSGRPATAGSGVSTAVRAAQYGRIADQMPGAFAIADYDGAWIIANSGLGSTTPTTDNRLEVAGARLTIARVESLRVQGVVIAYILEIER